MPLALKKGDFPSFKISYVYLTMLRPAMKSDPTPLMRSIFLWHGCGRVNEVPWYLIYQHYLFLLIIAKRASFFRA